MREHTPPAAADVLSPASRPAYGVAASYLLGHFVLLWAERPALATTFSQTGAHQAGNERAGAILAALDDDVAYERARASGVRYVVASPPYEMPGFPSLDPRRSLLARLTRNAGMATARDPATAHFRLIHGDGEPCGGAPGRPAARVFEVVPGAELAGEAPPGTEVQARLEVGGMDYRRTAVADSSGRFHLRVAYPTRGEAVAFGTNPVGYRLESGGRAANVQVDDRAVRWGEVLQTRLDPP
jgi:dolichyl-diphosphooligosaccharide--protein glycosyltransferase